MAFDPAKIEEKIDRAVTAAIPIDDAAFGLSLRTLQDAYEYAKGMALSKQAIPAFMRNEPGVCNAAVIRSLRWRLDPYFVAENMYLTKNPKSGEEKIAFMSQLFNAVVNNAQPLILEGKLRVRYEGAGGDLKAIIYGIPKHETEAIEYETPTLAQRIAKIGRNDAGHLKGSPLYDDDPKQALWYFGSRAFIRRYFPHVLAGVYAGEELAEGGFEPMRDITPTPDAKPATVLSERLKANRRADAPQQRGFDPDAINRAKESVSNGGKADAGEAANTENDDGGKNGGTTGGNGSEIRERNADSAGGADEQGASGDAVGQTGDAGERAAGGEETQGQQELIPPGEGETGGKRNRRR